MPSLESEAAFFVFWVVVCGMWYVVCGTSSVIYHLLRYTILYVLAFRRF